MNARPRQYQHRISNCEQCGLTLRNFSLLSSTACGFLRKNAILRPRQLGRWAAFVSTTILLQLADEPLHGGALRKHADASRSPPRSRLMLWTAPTLRHRCAKGVVARSRPWVMPGTDRVKKGGGSRRSLASVRSLPLPWLPRWVIGKHSRPDATWRPGSGLFPSSTPTESLNRPSANPALTSVPGPLATLK